MAGLLIWSVLLMAAQSLIVTQRHPRRIDDDHVTRVKEELFLGRSDIDGESH